MYKWMSQLTKLVGGLEHVSFFVRILGMSSSQVTNIVQRGWNHQPALICLSMYVYLLIYLSIYQSINISINLSIWICLFVYLSIYLSNCFKLYLTYSIYILLSICHVYIYICISMYIYIVVLWYDPYGAHAWDGWTYSGYLVTKMISWWYLHLTIWPWHLGVTYVQKTMVDNDWRISMYSKSISDTNQCCLHSWLWWVVIAHDAPTGPGECDTFCRAVHVTWSCIRTWCCAHVALPVS
jgi:hypothetical protein